MFVLLFTRFALQGIVCYTFQVNGRAVMSLPLHKGAFDLYTPIFLTSTAIVDTKAKMISLFIKKIFQATKQSIIFHR